MMNNTKIKIAATALGLAAFVGLANHNVNQMSDLPKHVVVVEVGDPVPDMEPGDQLDIKGLTHEECDDAGGRPDPIFCRDVDF